MGFGAAGGECLRLRYFVSSVNITGNTFRDCGVYAYRLNEGGKNGEAIYIGTADNQRGDNASSKFGWTSDIDRTNRILVHGNNIITNGNECVDIKRGAHYVTVQHNQCSGQRDTESGGVSINGYHNTVRNNTLFNNRGVGIRMGDTSSYNSAYHNVLRNNLHGGFKFKSRTHTTICGNNLNQQQNPHTRGTYGSQFANQVSRPC